MIVQLFNILGSELEQQITDEYECPLLTLTNTVSVYSSSCILHPVSIIHYCTESCKFHSTSVTKNIEHELVSTEGIKYVHDWTNFTFSLNIFNVNTCYFY